jgi:hypothetical protein
LDLETQTLFTHFFSNALTLSHFGVGKLNGEVCAGLLNPKKMEETTGTQTPQTNASTNIHFVTLQRLFVGFVCKGII